MKWHTHHRPWPLPSSPWIMRMDWHDLLFMHWPIPVSVLRPLIPHSLKIDTYEGEAWIGIVPFRMSNVRPRWIPPAPWLSAFPELNVRTYVTIEDKPGVWFFSLDAARLMAVKAARLTFHLPYFWARMSIHNQDGVFHYRSKRIDRSSTHADFICRYRPVGPVRIIDKGSLDHWLTERYCLYAADRQGKIFRGEIHHDPWSLQPAEAEIKLNTLTAPLGFQLPDEAPLLHFSIKQEVVGWALQSVNG